MKVHWQNHTLSKVEADVLVMPIYLNEDLVKLFTSLDKNLSKAALALIKDVAHEDGFTGKTGQQLWLPTYDNLPFKKICLYGLGSNEDQSVYRKMGAQVARKLSSLNGAAKSKSGAGAKANSRRQVTFYLRSGKNLAIEKALESALEAFVLATYSFVKYKTQTAKDDSASQPFFTKWAVSFTGKDLTEAKFAQVTSRALAMADATNMARALIAEPPAYMTPSRLALEARRIAKDHDLDIKVMDQTQIEKLGMGSFLGVAKGAKEPPKFIVLKYNKAKSKKTVALVGKGITFDSGGLSLKPAQSMEHMKYDMAGAAAVLGAMQVIGQLKPKVSVMAVIAATENMPGDNALHPGDVLVSMNGKTIEVNNTDAEGRLILADAICYALREGADEVIDIATLTGAVVTALGRVAAGIMGHDDLAQKVMESGKEHGEKFWQLPLFEEYKEGLKSDIADLKNAGSRGEAGSSSAGMFLKEFTESKPWVHLDIAGVGWIDRDKDELNKGGTGFGVRTLSQYVLNQ
ncbi:MAG: leucyl aminopeptidase [Candidatus Obscuribacter sp.]|nr:leucyl aminopeptidase [Candidatus Obscuribacter sp.]